ncbi:hypothetical protein HQ325_16575 [Rhodococcus sp. BP-349]|uniref:hypothetical protein n=1 Tax=unclassified Rhodococcus (in: high G+C Gram-positive bacteria) TaxID=192944 RepID=UPI001C9A9F56|nr:MULTISPECIES: hypothetical protein [unclassified Rhodococcus (in: high G+C Gram-positive bacteria)]MBY6540290.1 hypothetical protein [Rhodococcus sp. BP-363]MBY6545685.1 hypothetical protein [Rhodococcus sp. BP-369]MBY6564915.1 hypothetical protein [Rhodococcus sp. BP-370]MBY6578149.1 hypothetical protein [Rhodococcus sp. BP-364]MBY6587450.1 hypothetical protein [Rhodococcus sp. BP-358]
MPTVPHDQIPAHLHLDLPVASSEQLAISLGPIQVYSDCVVLRFEAADLSSTRRNRPFLAPTRRATEAHMTLLCTATVRGSETVLNATVAPIRSFNYGGRVTNYFAIEFPLDAEQFTVSYSYREMGIPLTTHSIDTGSVAAHRALVRTVGGGDHA